MIHITRGRESKYGTFGRLIMPQFTCLTLELPDRDNRVSLSRIPSGEYTMRRVVTRRPFSGRPDSFWLHPVDGRTGILIHSGTWAGDRTQGLRTHSWGCLLLGSKAAWVNGQPGLLHSRTTVWRFMGLLDDMHTIRID